VRPEEPELTRARLGLARAVAQVLRNGLGLLGISAPESM
jgi:arginyl-tRNA synthetase